MIGEGWLVLHSLGGGVCEITSLYKRDVANCVAGWRL